MLPTALVVTRLVIRLQFLRHFSIRKGLSPIIRALPLLQALWYECWQGLNAGAPTTAQKIRQDDHLLLFNHILPQRKHLSELCLYERSNSQYCEIQPSEERDPMVGHVLGVQSHRLRQLHIGGIVDEKDFFYNFWPDATAGQQLVRTVWPNMIYLSL
jgi:hypothetical protein